MGALLVLLGVLFVTGVGLTMLIGLAKVFTSPTEVGQQVGREMLENPVGFLAGHEIELHQRATPPAGETYQRMSQVSHEYRSGRMQRDEYDEWAKYFRQK